MVWLDQAFAHCPIFRTAASKLSLGLVSVPMWSSILLNRLEDTDFNLISPVYIDQKAFKTLCYLGFYTSL